MQQVKTKERKPMKGKPKRVRKPKAVAVVAADVPAVANVSREMLLAGQATFTVEVPEAHRPEGKKPHYTYLCEKVEPSSDGKWPTSWFVRVFTGTENANRDHYTYLGKLDTFLGQVVRTGKSAFPAHSFRLRLLNHILARVWSDDHEAYTVHGFVLHHEGMCCRCGRKLTTPRSCSLGIGPECAKLPKGEKMISSVP